MLLEEKRIHRRQPYEIGFEIERIKVYIATNFLKDRLKTKTKTTQFHALKKFGGIVRADLLSRALYGNSHRLEDSDD